MPPLTGNSLCATLVFMIASCGSWSPEFASKQLLLRVNQNTIGKITSPSHSTISADDVMKPITAFIKNSSRGVTLLYGPEYEEVINDLPELVAAEFVVQMSFKSDGKSETLRQMLTLSKKKSFLLLLETPASVLNIFQTMRKKMLKTHLVTWLLIMEGSDAHVSVARLEEFVNEGTQVIIFVKTSHGHFIHYLPSVDAYGITRFTNEGRWERAKELKAILSLEPQETYDLSGRHFKVAIKEIVLVLKVRKTLPDGSVEITGTDASIMNDLGSALNFTYKAYIPRDNAWGDLMPDGNVTGIIGMVAKGEANLGISVMSISDTRIRVVDFTAAYHSGRYLLMSRSPKEKNKALSILSPFTLQIWVFLTSTALLMGPVVYSISFLLYKLVAADVKMDLQWFQFNIFRSIVNQGSCINDDSLQVRLVLLFWFFFCSINAALYSGMLTAVLAIPAYETPIDSFEDLPRAVKDGFTVGTLGGSNYESFFKAATEGVLKQTWGLFNHEDRSKSFVDNVYTGVNRVLEEKFVFIIGDGFARLFEIMHGKEKLHLGREKLFPTYIGIVCQKGSPVTGALSRAVLRMADGGLLKKLTDDAYRIPAANRPAQETETKNIAITLTHLQAAFYMLALGIMISTVAMLVEKVTFYVNLQKEILF
ncbi:glutamate receptor ionotropic, kainate glr-3-like isoform X2 [Macrobrachium rosenbergii]